MFDYGCVDEVIGLEILKLYVKPEDYGKFMREMRARDAANQPVEGYLLPVRTHVGREIWIEVNSRFQKDRAGRVVGRTGAVRDVSAERSLRQRLELLQADVGRVLHSYGSTLVMIRHRLRPTITALGPDPSSSKGAPPREEVDQIMADLALGLAGSLTEFMNVARTRGTRDARLLEELRDLARYRALLSGYRDQVSILEFRPPLLSSTARCVINVLAGREWDTNLTALASEAAQAARQVERAASIFGLRYAELEIASMDHDIRALREHVTTGVRPTEPEEVVLIWLLVRQAMENLQDYAILKGVEFRPHNQCPGVRVKVVERDVLRGLTNLLHNAIKYSWTRTGGEPPWVKIEASEEGPNVRVRFENYGVPIPKQETETGLIFEVGYRGQFSAAQGRVGAGIGLSDTLTTALRHRGTVEVQSRPADSGAAEDDFSGAFVTQATLVIPRYA
jgi:signal transduction histidine kinase